MTATPIPRTVAMTVFGDLETSTLAELPAGRAPIQTNVVPLAEAPAWMERAFQRVREEVAKGHQVYVVCPRIGGDDDKAPDGGGEDDARPTAAVEEVAPELAEGALRGLRIEALHGRLPADRKDEVMRGFAAGDVDVLVSTTVIEVGVDVANATMMVVLDADRFGVSQLHQLRGRVGRGGLPGLCLLVTQAPAGSPARERLDAVAATTDGFELSRVDLEQRREGDVLGVSQSGRRSSLRLLHVLEHEDVIVEAREVAARLVAERPRPRRAPPARRAGPPPPRGRAGRLPGQGVTRIIAGSAGGRRIKAPAGQSTRPTSDRVREALFSAVDAALGSLSGLRFLDVYAGSGAVGLEARSRGAGVVTLVEHDRRTAAVIRENARTLGFHGVDVVVAPARRALAQPPVAPYDVVFLDPPYALPVTDVEDDLVALDAPRLAGARGARRRRAVQRAAPGRRGRRGSWPTVRAATARRRFGTVTPPAAARDPPDPPRGADRAPSRVPGVVRPGDQRSHRHHLAGVRAVRRGRRRGRREPVEEAAVLRRGAHRDAHRGVRAVRQRQHRRVRRAAHRLLPGPRRARHREGAAGGQRLRLRAPDGADEHQPLRHRDGLRADQPGVLLPGLQPGQGGRDVRR